MALKNAKNGTNRCPNCGATDVKLDIKSGKLKCNYCRSTFDEKKKANAFGGVDKLKGEHIAEGAELIIPSEKVIVTLRCPSCGAEVVINTDEAVSARCHWCRHTLSLNEKMKNGAVPDLVLPFSLEKAKAEENIRTFVNKRKFFAHPKFRREFKPENVMGVYLPYMVVDINAHANMSGEAEHLIRRYTVGSNKHRRTYYDAEAFSVTRDFGLLVDDLTIEASSDKLKMDLHKDTKNVINAIMPFDTENCEEWNPNYLHGFASERRDTNVKDLRDQLTLQVGDIARFKVKESMTYYNRGARWTKEDISTTGSKWKAAYLPVWLYSYLEENNKGEKLLHYVAVNGRTGETMGSVPINKTRLRIVAAFLEIIGMFIGFNWIKFWLHVDSGDDDNPAMWGLAGLTPGFIFYWVMTARYRNMNARHKHEAETKADVVDLKKTDVSLGRRNRLSSASIAGRNDSIIKGAIAGNAKKMMGEKMANFLGIGRMAKTKPTDVPEIGENTKPSNAKVVSTIVRSIVITFALTMLIVVGAFIISSISVSKKRGNTHGSVTDIGVLMSDVKEGLWSGESIDDYVTNMALYSYKEKNKYLTIDHLDRGFQLSTEVVSGNSVRNVGEREFATERATELFNILTENKMTRQKVVWRNEAKTSRSALFYSVMLRKKDIVACDLSETLTKRTDDGYRHLVQLKCIPTNYEELEANGIR